MERIERFWEEEALGGGMYTVPWLDLSRQCLEAYVAGAAEPAEARWVPERAMLRDVAGKDVLCLASGGGQQSVAYGLLGARVTVVDISEAQLNSDRVAAAHYGYDVQTVKADMRDLSCLAAASFDLVYQPISICFVPEVREVYREVHRMLRPGSLYSVSHCNPATYPTCFEGGGNGWDGTGYRIAEPYAGGPIMMSGDGTENMRLGEPTGEYRHLLSDIFDGLLECGFVISAVAESPRHLPPHLPGRPGSSEHFWAYVAQYFTVICHSTGG